MYAHGDHEEAELAGDDKGLPQPNFAHWYDDEDHSQIVAGWRCKLNLHYAKDRYTLLNEDNTPYIPLDELTEQARAIIKESHPDTVRSTLTIVPCQSFNPYSDQQRDEKIRAFKDAIRGILDLTADIDQHVVLFPIDKGRAHWCLGQMQIVTATKENKKYILDIPQILTYDPYQNGIEVIPATERDALAVLIRPVIAGFKQSPDQIFNCDIAPGIVGRQIDASSCGPIAAHLVSQYIKSGAILDAKDYVYDRNRVMQIRRGQIQLAYLTGYRIVPRQILNHSFTARTVDPNASVLAEKFKIFLASLDATLSQKFYALAFPFVSAELIGEIENNADERKKQVLESYVNAIKLKANAKGIEIAVLDDEQKRQNSMALKTWFLMPDIDEAKLAAKQFDLDKILAHFAELKQRGIMLPFFKDKVYTAADGAAYPIPELEWAPQPSIKELKSPDESKNGRERLIDVLMYMFIAELLVAAKPESAPVAKQKAGFPRPEKFTLDDDAEKDVLGPVDSLRALQVVNPEYGYKFVGAGVTCAALVAPRVGVEMLTNYENTRYVGEFAVSGIKVGGGVEKRQADGLPETFFYGYRDSLGTMQEGYGKFMVHRLSPLQNVQIIYTGPINLGKPNGFGTVDITLQKIQIFAECRFNNGNLLEVIKIVTKLTINTKVFLTNIFKAEYELSLTTDLQALDISNQKRIRAGELLAAVRPAPVLHSRAATELRLAAEPMPSTGDLMAYVTDAELQMLDDAVNADHLDITLEFSDSDAAAPPKMRGA